ncbi:MAG: hypothetical protein AB7O44_27530 [Hyphomicrobiaceae bacterium]
MTEVERMARLLCEADFWDSDDPDTLHLYTPQAERLHTSGLALVPREPDEARVERVALKIAAHTFRLHQEPEHAARLYLAAHPDALKDYRAQARAACRAMVEEG